MSYSYFNPTPMGSPQVNAVPPMQQTPAVMPQASTNNFNYTMQQNMFPQPTGSVYNLSTASDIGNIPAGLGISVGLCLQENLMYIKSLQNGSPVLLGYRLVPLETAANGINMESDYSSNEILKENKRLLEVMKDHDDKIHMLEEQLVKLKDKIGGKSEWQI